jgi:hypothetical protein
VDELRETSTLVLLGEDALREEGALRRLVHAVGLHAACPA